MLLYRETLGGPADRLVTTKEISKKNWLGLLLQEKTLGARGSVAMVLNEPQQICLPYSLAANCTI